MFALPVRAGDDGIRAQRHGEHGEIVGGRRIRRVAHDHAGNVLHQRLGIRAISADQLREARGA
jgi:hypothetical protein